MNPQRKIDIAYYETFPASKNAIQYPKRGGLVVVPLETLQPSGWSFPRFLDAGFVDHPFAMCLAWIAGRRADIRWHLHSDLSTHEIFDQANLIEAWYDPDTETFVMKFRGPAMPEIAEGEQYPIVGCFSGRRRT